MNQNEAVVNVLVTGASGGIGSALVVALLADGHTVTAVGRDPERLRPLADRGARALVADLNDVGSLAQAVEAAGAAEVTNEQHALVHCAGVADIALVAETAPEVWQRTLTVNVAAAAELTRLLLPALRRARGHVVFVHASPWMRAVPRWSAFVASKAALRELADSLRAEEMPNGVRVTTIYPGATATEKLREIRAEFGRDHDPAFCIQPETLARMVCWVLRAPADAYAAELSVLPAP
jgi:NADP-dependent 3-hydroxy acid dehydrogenase YdfG